VQELRKVKTYLINGTRNQAGYIGLFAKHVREGVGKARRSLDRAEGDLSDIITRRQMRNKTGVIEMTWTHDSVNPNVERAALKVIWRAIFCTLTKNAPLKNKIGSVEFIALNYAVELPDIAKIAENKGLGQVKAYGDDILRIGMSKL
jgi:hypothetical protein